LKLYKLEFKSLRKDLWSGLRKITILHNFLSKLQDAPTDILFDTSQIVTVAFY
jgi:hypothetical protein